MKSEKGITLVSLIVYVIAMLITVTIISVVTSYFYKNVDLNTETYDYLAEFTKIESFLAKEANVKDNKITTINPGTTSSQSTAKQVYVILSSGNQYTFVKVNKALYQNKVKIASHIDNCTFEKSTDNKTLTLTVTIKDTTRTMKFTL